MSASHVARTEQRTTAAIGATTDDPVTLAITKMPASVRVRAALLVAAAACGSRSRARRPQRRSGETAGSRKKMPTNAAPATPIRKRS